MRDMKDYKQAFRTAYEFMERYLNAKTEDEWRAAVKELEAMDSFTTALICPIVLEIERASGETKQ